MVERAVSAEVDRVNSMIDISRPDEIMQALATDGACVVPNMLSDSLLENLREDIDNGTRHCLEIQSRQKVGGSQALKEAAEGGDGALGGAAHHIVLFENSFFDLLLQRPLFEHIEKHLGGSPFILNSFGAVTNTNRNNMYEHGKTIHRDTRSFHPTFQQECWLMVMVDEFTIENGATWMWSGSQTREHVPPEDEFYANAQQVTGPAGSIVIFDGRIWHAAGKNVTDHPRRALTISFTRPFIKPQMDYVRYFGAERVAGMPETLQQLFGYFSRIPSNYDEWYQPPETRFYRSNQG